MLVIEKGMIRGLYLEEAVYACLPTKVVRQILSIVQTNSRTDEIGICRLVVAEGNQVLLGSIGSLAVAWIACQVGESVVLEDNRATDCRIARVVGDIVDVIHEGVRRICFVVPEKAFCRQASRSIKSWLELIGEDSRLLQQSLDMLFIVRSWLDIATLQYIVGRQQATEVSNGGLEGADWLLAVASSEVNGCNVGKLGSDDVSQVHQDGGVHAIHDGDSPAPKVVDAGIVHYEDRVVAETVLSILIPRSNISIDYSVGSSDVAGRRGLDRVAGDH